MLDIVSEFISLIFWMEDENLLQEPNFMEVLIAPKIQIMEPVNYNNDYEEITLNFILDQLETAYACNNLDVMVIQMEKIRNFIKNNPESQPFVEINNRDMIKLFLALSSPENDEKVRKIAIICLSTLSSFSFYSEQLLEFGYPNVLKYYLRNPFDGIIQHIYRGLGNFINANHSFSESVVSFFTEELIFGTAFANLNGENIFFIMYFIEKFVLNVESIDLRIAKHCMNLALLVVKMEISPEICKASSYHLYALRTIYQLLSEEKGLDNNQKRELCDDNLYDYISRYLIVEGINKEKKLTCEIIIELIALDIPDSIKCVSPMINLILNPKFEDLNSRILQALTTLVGKIDLFQLLEEVNLFEIITSLMKSNNAVTKNESAILLCEMIKHSSDEMNMQVFLNEEIIDILLEFIGSDSSELLYPLIVALQCLLDVAKEHKIEIEFITYILNNCDQSIFEEIGLEMPDSLVAGVAISFSSDVDAIKESIDSF